MKLSLLELEGDALLDEGKDAQADKKFAEVVELWKQQGEQNSSSWNNAAVALMRRYSATGERKHVAAAV